MKGYTKQAIIHWDGTAGSSVCGNIIAEEPLSIRIQGNPYSVIMRTPGDEIDHVAGFCLAEGIVDFPADFNAIGFCDGTDTNVVTVTLTASRRKKIAPTLDRRGYISQTSCGICGKEVVRDLQQAISSVLKGPTLSADRILKCIDTLSDHQPLRRQTKASHAAALFNSDFNLLAAAEDVGRHNALDKLVGACLRDAAGASNESFIVVSSRASFELVQKTVRAGLPMMVAIGAASSLAIETAWHFDLTLVGFARESRFNVYSRGERIALEPSDAAFVQVEAG